MIKNRTAQLIFLTVYCTIGLIGTIASLGFFDYTYRSDWYVHFTNLSNYICIGIVFAELVQTVKKKTDSYITVCPTFKFIGILMILLTFFAFNILLASAPDRLPELNFKVNSITFHIVLPVLYVADWFLFYERKKVKWYAPLLSTIAPLVYVVFIFTRAWILDFNPDVPFLYPYFFLNLDTLGVAGVTKWVLILFSAFIAVGYILFAVDKLSKAKDA